jgi:hypothetical protein
MYNETYLLDVIHQFVDLKPAMFDFATYLAGASKPLYKFNKVIAIPYPSKLENINKAVMSPGDAF